MNTSNDLQVDALRLAHYGRPVFPCKNTPDNKETDKTPYVSGGFKSATTEVAQIKDWWTRWPDALVGVPTGTASGIFVVDVDCSRHDEANDWLERWSPYLPETRQHATRSGGWHLLFKHRAGLKNTTSRLATGVDTRGEGGYFIWWPFHMGLLAPHKLDLPLCELPDQLYRQLVEQPGAKLPIHRPAFGRFIGQPNRKVQGVINAIAQAREGNRNSIVYWGACVIRDMIANREIGGMEGSLSFTALAGVAQTTGLPAREVARTIESAVGRR